MVGTKDDEKVVEMGYLPAGAMAGKLDHLMAAWKDSRLVGKMDVVQAVLWVGE